MRQPRSAGLLLHPTSLPGPEAIGDLGVEAEHFVDFLESAGQRLWQVLPLGPVGPGDSPYAGTSAFAGNPLLVSLARLAEDGLDVGDPPRRTSYRTDYGRAAAEKWPRLRRALADFRADRERVAELDSFREQHRGWLEDYALFTAIKEAHGGAGWTSWPEPLAHRDPTALARFRSEHGDAVELQEVVQLLFERQWAAVKAYANRRGVRIMGDVPIFVAHDSADVWAHPELFHLDRAGQPTIVAGVPPDYFSPTGQLWGNPIYRWDVLAQDGYRWWVERFRRVLGQVDLVRVDHFRGFAAHWSVPAGEKTAIKGRWQKAPGLQLFKAVERGLGDDLPIVAEDLGTITPDVVALLDKLGFPGMKVLQFAFGDKPDNPYLPHNFRPNAVVYTGTHDNDTTVGWYAALKPDERHRVRTYLQSDGDEIAWDMIRLALGSVADTAIAPLQDVLSLETESRMNTPGRGEGNWTWRFHAGQLSDDLAVRLRALTEMFNRLPAADEE
jgi:4-alpha-glucanotransferase